MFYLIHHPCEYGHGNHTIGPFDNRQAADEAKATLEIPDAEHWHVAAAADRYLDR